MLKKTVVAIMLVASMLSCMVPANAWVYPDGSEDEKVEYFGPRADRLIINLYNSEFSESLALENGDIDFTDSISPPSYVDRWANPPYNETIKLDWRGTGYDTFMLEKN